MTTGIIDSPYPPEVEPSTYQASIPIIDSETGGGKGIIHFLSGKEMQPVFLGEMVDSFC